MPAARFRLVTTVAALILSLFLGVVLVRSQVNDTPILPAWKQLDLRAFRDGTVERPFVFRVLTPELMRLAEPVAVRLMDSGKLPDWLGAKIRNICSKAAVRGPPQPCDLVIAYCIVAAAGAFGFFAAMFFVFRQLHAGDALAMLGVLLSFLIANGIVLTGLAFPYDFPVLMFAALLTLCLLADNKPIYYLILLPAILTKESLILYLVGFLAVNYRVMPRRRLIMHAALQSALFSAVYLTLLFVFRNVNGSPVWLTLVSQFYAASALRLPDVLLLLSVVVGLFYRFSAKDGRLKAISLMLAPWFVLFVAGGLGLRVAFEVLPVMILLIADTLLTLVTGTPRLHSRERGVAEARRG